MTISILIDQQYTEGLLLAVLLGQPAEPGLVWVIDVNRNESVILDFCKSGADRWRMWGDTQVPFL